MRALIVDDEARVRKAIRLLVDWDTHGIKEIEEAGSGSEAIQVIQTFRPALVIMDMMMNSGNGLDLMEWVSEFASSIKFIVVSGHDDFNFVRSAVRHGGIDYILKPIEPDAINAAVAKAVHEWQREEQERVDQHYKSIQLNEFKPVYGEKLLTSLIDDPGSADSSLRRLRLDGVIPEHVQSSRLLLIQVDSGDSALLQRFEHDSELLHFSLINICNEFLLSERRGIAFKHWGASMEILILIWEQLDRVPELISQINQGIFHTLQRKMHFGVSSIGEIPRSLPAQYSEAVTAVRRRNLLLPDLYIHSIQANTPGAGGGKPHISFTKVQEDWKIAVLSGNRTKITSASQGWIDLLRSGDNLTPELLETWRADILNFRAGLLREMISGDTDLALEELESYDLTSPSPSTSSYTFSQFAWRDWSDKLMNRLAEVISKHQAPEKKTINDIVKYIEQNYQSELSLQDISSHFFVSREYISRKFKQDFGINFSDYLSNYRIDKAKQLMLNPHLRVQQIADMVGIHDVKYFSKVFKKQVGLSPREYRSNLEV